MLVIVMHNNQEYLEFVTHLAKKIGILDTRVIKGSDIGTRLIGGGANFILSQGKMIQAYDKAFVTTIEDGKKSKLFLKAMKDDSFLDRLNIDDKGFICTVPVCHIRYTEPKLAIKGKEDGSMKISDFLKEEKMILDLKASSKKEAIEELASFLGNAKEIVNPNLFLSDVFEREEVGSTGVGNHVAIPHARTDSVNDFVVAFGRSNDGVEFDSLDGKPAKLIFLMGTPKSKGLNGYLMILANLTRLLNKADFRKTLELASSPKEIIEAFLKQDNSPR